VTETYLMVDEDSQLERLQLEARVWNPVGRSLLAPYAEELNHARVLDAGCGPLGWLPLLSRAVGPRGKVVGSDHDTTCLGAAQATIEAEGLANVSLVEDDLFASQLTPGFDLVHARFRLAPLGRAEEQLAAYRGLLGEGGLLVLEEPDPGSWHFNPPAPATERLISALVDAFADAGGDFSAGRRLAHLVRDELGVEAALDAHVLALPPGHPYLSLPLQLATSLRPRLERIVYGRELERLEATAVEELADPTRWGTTFTLVQAVARV
jgi:SAM-dependent methyltransferase